MLESAGRYQIQEELGRGAMGVVYRGFDPTIGRTVAIKTIHLETNDQETLSRFRSEARAAGGLSHPNIVTIYDAGEDQGLFYIAMEYVRGETLQARMERGTISFETAIGIIQQVGAALDHAHARHVVHRDVKPANIMLAPDGTAKVMDFGVAKLSTVNMTTTGQILGTPAYLSPEAIKGRDVDGRSDIFSLGVVLYEMLFSAKPFAGDITTVIYKILHESPQAPPTRQVQISPGVQHVLDKVLAKDAGSRYQTCAALVAELKTCRSSAFKPAPVAAAAASAPAPVKTVILPPQSAPRPRPAQREAQPLTKVRTAYSVRPGFILTVAVIIAVIGGATVWELNRLFPVEAPVQQTVAQPPSLSAPNTKPVQRKAGARTKEDEAFNAVIANVKPAGSLSSEVDPIQLLVTSNVERATIVVDGKTRPEWATPQTLRLKLGYHRIEVRKAGYKSEARSILFTEPASKSSNFDLEPLSTSQAPPDEEPR